MHAYGIILFICGWWYNSWYTLFTMDLIDGFNFCIGFNGWISFFILGLIDEFNFYNRFNG